MHNTVESGEADAVSNLIWSKDMMCFRTLENAGRRSADRAAKDGRCRKCWLAEVHVDW